jgi:hypothetical protein
VPEQEYETRKKLNKTDSFVVVPITVEDESLSIDSMSICEEHVNCTDIELPPCKENRANFIIPDNPANTLASHETE